MLMGKFIIWGGPWR